MNFRNVNELIGHSVYLNTYENIMLSSCTPGKLPTFYSQAILIKKIKLLIKQIIRTVALSLKTCCSLMSFGDPFSKVLKLHIVCQNKLFYYSLYS